MNDEEIVKEIAGNADSSEDECDESVEKNFEPEISLNVLKNWKQHLVKNFHASQGLPTFSSIHKVFIKSIISRLSTNKQTASFFNLLKCLLNIHKYMFEYMYVYIF